MKKTVQQIALFTTLLCGFLLSTPTYGAKGNKDPRIRIEGQQLKIWLLNTLESKFIVRVYNTSNELIHFNRLGTEVTLGKILDFENSRRGYYRIVVSSKEGILFDNRLILGTK